MNRASMQEMSHFVRHDDKVLQYAEYTTVLKPPLGVGGSYLLFSFRFFCSTTARIINSAEVLADCTSP